MKTTRYYALCILTLFLASGCYNDTEEDLYGAAVCDLTNVSYSLGVEPIVAASCYACHSQANAPANGAGIILEGYDKLLMAVNNGLLMESITHGANASPMPKNAPSLSACKIDMIKKWIENGALND
ncbi:MAG: hypothetical protein OEY56_08300 [Cyclobacteriaceae bacterium]|nr:hypothetical protein [Cyclobacteriaceae bacterium]